MILSYTIIFHFTGLGQKKLVSFGISFFRGCCNLEKTKRFGGWKKIGHKKDWLSKQKKEAEAPNIPTLYIYIYTTYGTLGNTYPPRLINTWWRMARNGALPPSSDGSPGMVLQHRLDTGRCCRRNNWQPPKWQFRKLACLWKKVHQNTKKENYISCIYIYIVLWQHVYIYILMYIYIQYCLPILLFFLAILQTTGL